MLRSLTGQPLLRVVAICSLFAALIAAGTYVAKDPLLGLFQSKTHSDANVSANLVSSDGLTGAISMAPDDPVKQFVHTQVGHILFSDVSSDNCRRTLFDNRTGLSYDAPDVFCGPVPEQVVEAQAADPLQSVGKSFKR